MATLHDVVALTSGTGFLCALDKTYAVRCWGTDPCAEFEADGPVFGAGAIDEPRAVRISVPVVAIRAQDRTLVMESADKHVYVAGQTGRGCTAAARIEDRDARSFVHVTQDRDCSLDAAGAVQCHLADRTTPSAAPKPKGFPSPARLLVAGNSGNEEGPILCAVGEGGALACSGGSSPIDSAKPVPVPPVRDLAIGLNSVRVLTTNGEVYDVATWLIAGPRPRRRKPTCGSTSAREASTIQRLPLDEPATAISAGACLLTRSGRTVCVDPD